MLTETAIICCSAQTLWCCSLSAGSTVATAVTVTSVPGRTATGGVVRPADDRLGMNKTYTGAERLERLIAKPSSKTQQQEEGKRKVKKAEARPATACQDARCLTGIGGLSSCSCHCVDGRVACSCCGSYWSSYHTSLICN